MLKLKRVEIHGFKSFFDKTEMRFNGSGIAAIVGPNGCGKSNLSDAMSWVLGEQSAKSLRGTRMEDVIFAGTRDRKALGMAAVTMTLLDPSGSLAPVPAETAAPANAVPGLLDVSPSNGAAPSNGATPANGAVPHASVVPHVHHGHTREITITRRLFRDGESEYLINGKTARLRDIQELFLGTGLGPESYAIIEQGRIGQILSNRPQDRRAVIEEAAGITRFKTKKRLAEAKLEGAKQNLSRVFDILEEVGRQVNSLKRQAAKAKRFEELKAEMTGHLRCALSGKFRMLEREAARTAIDLGQAQSEAAAVGARVGESENEQGLIQTRAYETEAELTAARARLAELRIEDERTRGRLESQSRQISSLESRLGEGERESQSLDDRQRQRSAELETLLASVAELEQQAAAGRDRLAAKSAERDALQQTLQSRSRGLEDARQQVLRLLGEASSLRNQLAKLDEFVLAMERDATRAQDGESAALADLDRLAELKTALAQQSAERQSQLSQALDQRRALEASLALRKAEAAEARKQLELLRADSSRIEARRRSLEEVLSHRTYTADSVKRLFTALERDKYSDFRPSGVLADFVEVDPAYEKAAEEFLHEELEFVVVNDWKEAQRGIELMRGDLDGRATFLVHPEPSEPHPDPVADAISSRPGVRGRLGDSIRFTNGLTQAPAGLLPRLSQCFLVDDHHAAQQLAVEFPGHHFLLPDGVSYQGQAVSGGKKTGAGPLQLKRELREATSNARHKNDERDDAAAALDAIERDIAGLAERLDAARIDQQAREKDLLALEHESRKLSEELSRAQQRLTVSRHELERLRQEGERTRDRREQIASVVEQKEASRAAQEQRLEEARREIDALQAQTAHLAEEHAALRAELAGLEERRRSARAEQARQENELRDLARRRQQLTADMERMGVDRARLLADNIELDARASALAESIAALAAEVDRLAAAEDSLRGQLAALDEALKQLRLDAQAALERRSQIELTLVRQQAELKFLDETSRKELGAPVAELDAAAETVPDEAALAEAEARYQELRARIDALGPVNPQALEEFQEAQQRYDFLNAQRQDLLDSIRDTERAIHEIDAETRKRFSEAFEAINANFRDMFKTLFGGGSGEMRLTDDTNIAESGIDIVASPPGKKLQNVLLLSGGEKSLTAMALLMAIFRYQPSPFCILDEIDAPLDEANIERLTRLLREMSDHTQFVVITHAKRTMEAAESLYGVTMQEPGVSKLVSVKFQPAAVRPIQPELAGVGA